jgi:predicted Zn-dependent peptidase
VTRHRPHRLPHALVTVVMVSVIVLLPMETEAQVPDLPVIEHTLENGMRFLLLPREGPATVSFVVHVPIGSVNESLGSTGIAHFLEHLLFKGSTSIGTEDVEAERELFARMDTVHDTLIRERGRVPFPDSGRVEALEDRIRILEDSARAYVRSSEYAEILTSAGARGLNATTSYEVTQYFVELPANQMELWFVLEADRMRSPVFREFYVEREVIAEERRSRIENDPRGRLWETHTAAAFQVHPYGVAPIGHMDDILSISRPAVEEYYRTHYGPGNTIVAIVGDFDPDSAVTWAREYFGPLERGDPPPPVLVREPEQRGERRVEVRADAEPHLRIGWKTPSIYHDDSPAVSVLMNLLVGGRESRLYQRLIRDDRIAVSVTAGSGAGLRYPGLFTLQATPRSGHTPEEVETAIYDELERLRRDPPTHTELERVRRRLEATGVRRLTSNLGLAFQLADSESYWGDWRTTFMWQARMSEVEAPDILRVLERYFHEDGRTVGILRRPEGVADGNGDAGGEHSITRAAATVAAPQSAPGAQADTLRPVGRAGVERLQVPPLTFEPPRASKHEVAGVTVFHLHDPTLPLVDFMVQIRGGTGHFPREKMASVSGMATFLRNGGTRSLSPDSVALLADLLAMDMGFASGGGGTVASLNSLTDTLDEGLDLFREVLTAPGFDPEVVEIWKAQQLEQVRRRTEDPVSLAYQEFNRLMYGDHPVGWVLEEGDLAEDRLDEERLREVHRTLFCRDRLTLGVAGDVEWEEIRPRIERFLAAWPVCESELQPAAEPEMRRSGAVYILPRETEQTTIVLGQPGGTRAEDSSDYFATQVGNLILGGGGFTSRLMRRLRTEEGLTYGASSLWTNPRGYEGVFGVVTQTRAERTPDALQAIAEILDEFRTTLPEADERDRAVDQIANGYVFAFASASQIVARQMNNHVLDLPEGWLERFLEGIQAVEPEDIRRVAAEHLEPGAMSVLLVGDATRFDPWIEGFGPIYRLSPDGTVEPWEPESRDDHPGAG